MIDLVTILGKHNCKYFLFTIKLIGRKGLLLSLPVLTPVDVLTHRSRAHSGRGFLALHRTD